MKKQISIITSLCISAGALLAPYASGYGVKANAYTAALSETTIIEPFVVGETSGYCGENAAWTLDDSGTLTISGTGELAGGSDVFGKNAKDIKNVNIKGGIATISPYVFKKCINLESVAIPDSVTEIGDNAFESCDKLESIKIPSSVTSIGRYAFSKCSSLKSVLISDNVTSIGDFAFESCSSLESVKIPASVKIIGHEAFGKCTGLKELVFSGSDIDINYSAFYGCKNIETLVLPNGTTNSIYEVFHDFDNLRSLTIPKNFSSDDECILFSANIETLTVLNPDFDFKKIYFHDTQDTIIYGYAGSTAQEYAEKEYLKFVALDAAETTTTTSAITTSVTTTTTTAINETTLPVSSVVRETSGTYGENATWKLDDNGTLTISGTGEMADTYTLFLKIRKDIKSVIIEEGITSINAYTFCDCINLESVTIPNTVTSLEKGTFAGCNSLKSIIIPDSVTSIGMYAFYNCSSLESIKIPSSVTLIDYCAFYGCTGLKELVFPASDINIDDTAFYGCKNIQTLTMLNPDFNFNKIHFDCTRDTTIYGYVGSTAQEYAEKEYLKFVALDAAETTTTSSTTTTTSGTATTTVSTTPKTTSKDYKAGDANCDGDVDLSDAVLIMQALANPNKYGESGSDKTHITKQGIENADVTGNDGMTTNDAQAIQKYLLKLVTELPIK